jgi:hypothetical protein
MKKVAAITIALSTVLLWGCSKDNSSNSNNPYYGPDYGPFTYKVDNVRDTSLEQSSEVIMIIQVEKLSGPAENVQFSATGLPEGATVTFDPGTALPPYNAIVKIKTERVPVGTYDINIEAYNKTSGIIRYPMTLTIRPYTKPSTALIGAYNTTGACTPQTGAFEHNSKIEAVEGNSSRVNLFGVWSPSWNTIVYADITDVQNGTFVIPSQEASGNTYTGSGTFDRNTITINYTVKGVVVNETCTTTMTRE